MNYLLAVIINIGFMVFGYLVGSLNTSIILGTLWKKTDIRKFHSNNAGATNSARVLGKKFGLCVLLLDIVKGAAVVAIVQGLALINQVGETYYFLPILAGFSCVIGHIYPVFFGFKGGKGVGCAIGVLTAVNVVLFVIAAIVFFSVALIWKYVSLASILSAVAMIIFGFVPWMINGTLTWNTEFVMQYWYVTSIIFALTCSLVIFAHRSNIVRLWNKTERKINLFHKA
ncbi:glycerol-3-phosphate 1-O-acyltransferase PlsY [Mycoplasma corogypsi]|uniref:glycerol-3-phosphate 1-O-acyltransferase PlsY n=1 Tax=Mycoplasma corogypsi TaxID=2106 RepID=UPI003873834B